MKKTLNKISLIVLTIIMIASTNTIHSQAKKATSATSKKGIQKSSTKYAALAIDKNNGFYYGLANDQTDLETAENTALNECLKKGGNCTIVLSFSGTGCGVYKTIEGSVGNAYGWGIAKTKEQADVIANKEYLSRSNGVPTNNSVFSCNSSNFGMLKVIFNALPEIKLAEEQRKIDDARKLQEKAIADEKAKILQKAKNECKEEYKNRFEKAKKYYEQCDYKNKQAYYDLDTYGKETYMIWNTKAFYAKEVMEHLDYTTPPPCDHLDDEAYLEKFNKSEKEYFDKIRINLEEGLEKVSQNAKRDEDLSQTYEAPKLMSVAEQFGNLEKILQDSQNQIAINQAARTGTRNVASTTRTAEANQKYDDMINRNSNTYNSSSSKPSKNESNSSGNSNESMNTKLYTYTVSHIHNGVGKTETEACENAIKNGKETEGEKNVTNIGNCDCKLMKAWNDPVGNYLCKVAISATMTSTTNPNTKYDNKPANVISK